MAFWMMKGKKSCSKEKNVSSSAGDICIENISLDMTSSGCGYPMCCPGKQPKFVRPPFPNRYIQNNLQLWDDLEDFMLESEEIFHKTGIPGCPCAFHHFCLPFSPFCAMYYCSWRRKNCLEQHVDQWNADKGLSKGIYLKWNRDFLTVTKPTCG